MSHGCDEGRVGDFTEENAVARILMTMWSMVILSGVMCLPGCNSKAGPETVAGRPTGTAAKPGDGGSAAEMAGDEKEIREVFERFWRLAG